MNIPLDQHEFVTDARVASQRNADAPIGARQSTAVAPDPRVPLQWQGSTGFRVAHFIAAAWVLACVAVGVGVYLFAAQ